MENSYSIEELIEMLEDLINDSTHVPFNKKSMVDVDKMNDVIQDMRMVLPMEIQQAQKVVMDKNNIIADAKREAESIIRKAEQRRAELLDESDIVVEARRRATEMVNAEQNHCADLRASTNDYVDKMLQRIGELLASDLSHIDALRAGINGAQYAPANQTVIQPMEKPGE